MDHQKVDDVGAGVAQQIWIREGIGKGLIFCWLDTVGLGTSSCRHLKNQIASVMYYSIRYIWRII